MIRMTPPTGCLLLLALSSLVASMAPLCEAFGTPPYSHIAQRRFMWKHMDSTVDAMRSMFSDLLTEPSPSPVTSALKDFHMPPDTMRVKYIIRKPSHMKPVKVIKLRATPKKVIKIMAVSPTPHYHHPSTKFTPHNHQPRPSAQSPLHSLPSSEDLRKLEKEQELKAEAQYNSQSGGSSSTANNNNNPTPNEVVSAKIQEYDGWTAVFGPGGSGDGGGGGGATSDTTAVAEPLTGNEAADDHEEHQASVKAYPLSKLHTNVLAEPLRQGNKHRDEYDDDGTEGNNPNDDEYDQSQSQYHSYAPSTNSYEVVEHQAEETVSLPQTHDPHTGQTRSGFRPVYGRGAGAHPSARTTAATTTTTTSTTTTEATPNYPAAYLRKLREREKERERAPLLAGSSSNISQRFKPSAETSNWQPISATANTSAAHLQYPSLRLTKPSATEPSHKAEKWPEEVPPKPRPFLMGHAKGGGSNGGGAALPPKAELLQKKSPVTFDNPEALPQDAEHHTRKRVKLRENKHKHNGGGGGGNGGGGLGGGAPSNAYRSESKYRQRGSIKFGDKLNIDELQR